MMMMMMMMMIAKTKENGQRERERERERESKKMSFLWRIVGGNDPTLPFGSIEKDAVKSYENGNGAWVMFDGTSKVREQDRAGLSLRASRAAVRACARAIEVAAMTPFFPCLSSSF